MSKLKEKVKVPYLKRVLRFTVFNVFDGLEDLGSWLLMGLLFFAIGVIPFGILAAFHVPIGLALLLGMVVLPPLILYHLTPVVKYIEKSVTKFIKWLHED